MFELLDTSGPQGRQESQREEQGRLAKSGHRCRGVRRGGRDHKIREIWPLRAARAGLTLLQRSSRRRERFNCEAFCAGTFAHDRCPAFFTSSPNAPRSRAAGVTLEALTTHARAAGWEQQVVLGVPDSDPRPAVAAVRAEEVHPLVFGNAPLDFPLPGMSDVMPYESTVFSNMSVQQVEAYRAAWVAHLRPIVDRFRPDVIHGHHVWILGSLLKDIAPDVPVVTHCHATGLRQMALAPHLAEPVQNGCRRNDHFVVLHSGHADGLVEKLGRRAVVRDGRRRGLSRRSLHPRGGWGPGASGALRGQIQPREGPPVAVGRGRAALGAYRGADPRRRGAAGAGRRPRPCGTGWRGCHPGWSCTVSSTRPRSRS